jgi:hypothetical protein
LADFFLQTHPVTLTLSQERKTLFYNFWIEGLLPGIGTGKQSASAVIIENQSATTNSLSRFADCHAR